MFSLTQENILWTNEVYCVASLIEQYALPQFVRIEIGHYGESERQTFEIGQILRFQEIKEQERILASDSYGNEYSIPLEYPHGVQVLRGKKGFNQQSDEKQIIKDIVENGFPQSIRLSNLYYHQSNITTSFDLKLQKKYTERFINANVVIDECLDKNVAIIPMYLDMDMKVAQGFSNRSQEDWDELVNHYSKSSSIINFSHVKGLNDITRYSDISIAVFKQQSIKRGTVVNSLYEQIKPEVLCTAPNENPYYFVWEASDKNKNVFQNKNEFPQADNSKACYLPLKRKHVLVGRSRPLQQCENKDRDLSLDNLVPPMESNTETPLNSNINSKFPEFLSNLSISEVADCLQKLNLGMYVKDFTENQIDGLLLQTLDEDILKTDFNFKTIQAKRLLLFINGWRPK